MKRVLLGGVLGCLALVSHAAESPASAYSALRVVGKRSGNDSLNRVVEVRGRAGVPAPAVWRITLEEPRGGIKELEVQRGQILGERTPVSPRTGVGAPMNFSQLNLDSEGAFTIANKEAEKAGLPFDQIDYLLHNGVTGSAPVWELQLRSGRRGVVATLEIAADNGAILREEGLAVRGPRSLPTPDSDSLDRSEREPAHNNAGFLKRAGDQLQKGGRSIRNFLLGEED